MSDLEDAERFIAEHRGDDVAVLRWFEEHSAPADAWMAATAERMERERREKAQYFRRFYLIVAMGLLVLTILFLTRWHP